MDSIELSIVIPTFNRLKNLEATLARLLLQSPGNIEIIVFDNASDYCIDDLRARYVDRSEIKIHRNEANIGLYANLFRAVEHARGKYVWTLGDDDLPGDHAIADIQAVIRAAASDTAAFKFSSHITQHKDESILELSALCRSIDNDWRYFSSLLFISTFVLHRDTYIRNIRHGYNNTQSNYSHLIPIFFALENGATLWTSSRVLVTGNQQVAATWAPGVIYLGLLVGSRLVQGNEDVNFADVIQRVVTRNGSLLYLAVLLLRIHFTINGENRKNYLRLYRGLSFRARVVWSVYVAVSPLLTRRLMPGLIRKLRLGDTSRV